MKTFLRESQADKVLSAHILDIAERCCRDCTVYSTRFLDERQSFLAEKLLSGRVDCNVRFWGGYENAQRKVCCIAPEWLEITDELVPIYCITFKYREADVLTHRDFLGAFMSLKIQRETIGDIVVGSGITQAFATETAAKLILEIDKIGRCGVQAIESETFDMLCVQNFREITGTVSSLRIDAVASLAIRLSREKTAGLIRQGKVELNYSVVCSSSLNVSEGDIFVVRGFGKFRLKSVTGLSKRERLHIIIEQYN